METLPKLTPTQALLLRAAARAKLSADMPKA
mgnify:CR=1 FL=1